MSREKILLPRFRKALAAHEQALPGGTYWRYANGIFPPPFGDLLVSDPELVEALAQDVRELQTQRSTPESAAEDQERAI